MDAGFTPNLVRIARRFTPNVKTEMSLHVLAYNLKRAMQIFGVVPLMKIIRT